MATITNIEELFLYSFHQTKEFPDWARNWGTVRFFEYMLKEKTIFEKSGPFASRNLDEDMHESKGKLKTSDLPEALLKQYKKIIDKKDVHIKKALDNNEELIKFSGKKISEDIKNDVNNIRDWLHSFSQETDQVKNKVIRHNTFEQAIEHTKKWHESLAKAASKQKNIEINREGLKTLIEYEDGSGWFELLTPETKDFEGLHMGHCVGSGGYDNKTIYSYRDSNNQPHCTIELDPNSKIIEQVKGKGNQVIVEKYIPKVIDFVNSVNPSDVKDAKNFGCFFHGRLYFGGEMPESFVYNQEKLNFSDFDVKIKNFPNRIFATNTDVVLDFKGANITATNFPQEIYVLGNLTIRNAKKASVGSLVCNNLSIENSELDFSNAAVITSEIPIPGSHILQKAIIDKKSKVVNINIIKIDEQTNEDKLEYVDHFSSFS